jgi:hypothetical protein
MKKLLTYTNGAKYVVSPRLSILPDGVSPVSEIDLSDATQMEIREIRKDVTNTELIENITNRSKRDEKGVK